MSGPRGLRVVSYNTRDFQDDVAAAARVIRDLHPDVLCLQEVPRRLGSPWRVARFARRCGLRWNGRHTGSGGTTIMTSPRMVVSSSMHYRLHVAALQRTRGYAVARVGLPGEPMLTVASVHLSLDAAERVRHTQQILRRIAGAGPTLLAGDLNEDESGEAWRLIAAPLRLISPTAPTYPSRTPHRLLDVIFASPGVRALPHARGEADPLDLASGSDHRPVWVDLATASA